MDAAREASRSGDSKRLSQAHESNASEHATDVHEADETQEDEDGQDTQDLLEILANRLSRKKLSGSRPASKSLRATVLSSDLYRQSSRSEDKKAWKQLSDTGKAMFIKHLPTSAESALSQRSTMTHVEVDLQILSRPSATVFIDCDNYSLTRNLSESSIDSEFLTFSALVCWRLFAFHKKLSPQWILVSI